MANPQPQKALAAQLDALHARIHRCHRCFKAKDNLPVTGKGLARTGGFLLVGQAPGIREPKAQMNFAWTAGRRLFKWLLTVGLSESKLRSNAYITAVTKCYPGKSKSGSGDRKPAPWEVEYCAPYLDELMRRLKPALVVPIGGLAVERFLGEKQMSVTIGQEYRREGPGGPTYIIPLPHPSGASPWAHMPGNREKLEKALRLIRRRLKKEGIEDWFIEGSMR
jgi:uracil-DNA glycosylase